MSLNLITDRTEADVRRLASILATTPRNRTEEQQAELDSHSSKGAYNYTDLNRVTKAMDTLADQFLALGYSTAGYHRLKAIESDESKLPTGYVELEYIESSGAQYINTEFNPTNNTHVVLRMSTSQSGSKTVFGSDLSWTGNGFTLGVNFAHYGTRNGSVLGLNDGAPHTLDFNKNVISLDGVKKLTLGEATFEMTYPIYLFCNNRAGAAQEHTALKLYSCKIYDQGYLVRDLVPCKSLTGIVGLYDHENSKFYKNIGSGAFVAGAEIAQPEVDPYVWTPEYCPTKNQMQQYLSNLEVLRHIIAVMSSTPTTPKTMEMLDYIKANNIEQILVDIDKLLTNMATAWYYSGDVYSGEV